MKKLLPLLLLFTSASLRASGEGTVDAEFLRFGAGARAAALAGTQAAMSDDVFAAYWNPAALGLLKSPEVALVENKWVQDVTHQYAAGALPLKGFGTWALSLQRVSIEDFLGADAQGTFTGNLSNSAQATGISWGMNLLGKKAAPGGGVFVGVSAVSFKETIAGISGTGRSYDLGALWRPSGTADSPAWWRRVALGAAVRRVGQAASFGGPSAKLPAESVVGAAYSHFFAGDILNVGADYHMTSAEKPFLSAGAEYWLNKFFALRAGTRTTQSAEGGLRAGAGFRIKSLQVDYAWSGMGSTLGSAHQVSLTWRFGSAGAVLAPGVADDLFAYHMAQGQAHMDLGMNDRAVLDFNEALRIRPQDDKALKLLLDCGEALKK